MHCDETRAEQRSHRMSDILRLTDVQVRIAGSHILQGIDFTVARGRRDRAARTQRGRQDDHPQGDPRHLVPGHREHRVRRPPDRRDADPSDRPVRGRLCAGGPRGVRLAHGRGESEAGRGPRRSSPTTTRCTICSPSCEIAGNNAPARCPVASSRWWRWPGCCSARLGCCWSTNRRRAWRRSWWRGGRRARPSRRADDGAAGGAEPAAGPADRRRRDRHRQRPGGAQLRRRVTARPTSSWSTRCSGSPRADHRTEAAPAAASGRTRMSSLILILTTGVGSGRAVFPGGVRTLADLRADARAELRARRLPHGRRLCGMGGQRRRCPAWVAGRSRPRCWSACWWVR